MSFTKVVHTKLSDEDRKRIVNEQQKLKNKLASFNDTPGAVPMNKKTKKRWIEDGTQEKVEMSMFNLRCKLDSDRLAREGPSRHMKLMMNKERMQKQAVERNLKKGKERKARKNAAQRKRRVEKVAAAAPT
jgi:hypothetical protein